MPNKWLKICLKGAVALICGSLILGGAATLLSPASAVAEENVSPQKPAEESPSTSPAQKPKLSREQALDFLFQALLVAPDDASATYISDKIHAIWLKSSSDTVNLLMRRVKVAMDAKEPDLALDILNHIVEIKPDYLEARTMRASINYGKEDFGSAMADLGYVLGREPRHFGALVGLGSVLLEIGDEKHALVVFRRALAINPHLVGVPELVKRLAAKFDDRDI